MSEKASIRFRWERTSDLLAKVEERIVGDPARAQTGRRRVATEEKSWVTCCLRWPGMGPTIRARPGGRCGWPTENFNAASVPSPTAPRPSTAGTWACSAAELDPPRLLERGEGREIGLVRLPTKPPDASVP